MPGLVLSDFPSLVAPQLPLFGQSAGHPSALQTQSGLWVYEDSSTILDFKFIVFSNTENDYSWIGPFLLRASYTTRPQVFTVFHWGRGGLRKPPWTGVEGKAWAGPIATQLS